MPDSPCQVASRRQQLQFRPFMHGPVPEDAAPVWAGVFVVAIDAGERADI